MKSLVLLRGLPGSGKSTLAFMLAEGRYPSFSVDDYFTSDNGYEFRYDENHLAYKQCEQRTENEMKKGAEKIFVHNTFTMEWEMEPYIRMAEENGYRVYVVTVENRHEGKNEHAIPAEQVQRMREKYKVIL